MGTESESAGTLSDQDRRHLLHPITQFRKHEEHGPTAIIVGGEGIRVRRDDGRELIDGLSGLFNINVGHGRTEIADAVSEQMRTQAYYPSFWGYTTEPAIRLAARLSELLPAETTLGHFLFATGGSDANELAFRLARLYHAVKGKPQRTKILSRRQAYHGATRAAGSATRLPVYHILNDPDPLHVETDAPYCFRCKTDSTYPGCGMSCVRDVEATIAREGADTIAAMIVEPVKGTGGVIVPPDEYFGQLQALCKQHDILLILDEVITGFGRTGKWFGLEHWDVRPDIITLAKGITSGYLPLGGVGINDAVYATLRDESPAGLPFMSGLTYNNHPSSCAAALANLDILEREQLVDNSAEQGSYLLSQLRARFADHPLIADVRGLGLLVAMESAAPGTKDPVGGKAGYFPTVLAKACLERGLIARALWESFALAPPLCINRAEVDTILDIVGDALDEVTPRFV